MSGREFQTHKKKLAFCDEEVDAFVVADGSRGAPARHRGTARQELLREALPVDAPHQHKS